MADGEHDPEQEARNALDFGTAGSGLSPEAQTDYDRLAETRARGIPERDPRADHATVPRWAATLITALSFPMGPGIVVVLLPFLITRWQPGQQGGARLVAAVPAPRAEQRERGADQTVGTCCRRRVAATDDGSGRYRSGMAACSTSPPGSPEPYEVIHLAREDAEAEATLAEHREWVAAGRPGAVSHEEAMAELLRGR